MARILVVDDSQIVLSLHSYMLEKAGFECAVAENGYVALEMLNREPFDLIVTDINMPKMDGYELTRNIRETEGYEGVPVIIVSTEQELKDRMKGLEAGANIYLVKPTEPEVLVANVKMLLSS